MTDPAAESPLPSPSVAVIGGGPAGLMAAEVLSRRGAAVTLYERMPSLGRKFLMAGRGGLNLTHSEDLAPFLKRYGAAADALTAAVQAFPPEALRAWCEDLGQETFVGSSGRVFPKTLKTSPLLRAWLARLRAQGVAFRLRHHWSGWDDSGSLTFRTPGGMARAEPDATLLALGGASWPRLGADGTWVPLLAEKGVAIAPLAPANCGFAVPWSDLFRRRFEGQPLKNIALRFAGESVRGDLVVTAYGLEGGALYGLSGPLRAALAGPKAVEMTLDLRPDVTAAKLAARLAASKKGQSLANRLRKAAGLSPIAANLLREGGGPLPAGDAGALAYRIKALPIAVTAPQDLARAISTAGGVAFDGLTPDFMLRARPGVFAAGEMLDWEAPTGGYLLQASFATGKAAAEGLLAWFARRATA